MGSKNNKKDSWYIWILPLLAIAAVCICIKIFCFDLNKPHIVVPNTNEQTVTNDETIDNNTDNPDKTEANDDEQESAINNNNSAIIEDSNEEDTSAGSDDKDEPEIVKYTITFKNYDDTTLQETSVAYGTTPTYNGNTPTKPADAQYTYTFNGWDTEITAVTGNKTYTATYTSTVNEYTITFKNYDDTTLQETSVAYGTTPTYNGNTPTKPADASIYIFDGWYPTIDVVTDTTTYTAKYKALEYMQDFAILAGSQKQLVTNSMMEGQQYILKDSRDGKEYYIAKLADGNVWMTENLDLDLNTKKTLTSKDTDLNLYGSMGYNTTNGYNCSNDNSDCENGDISFTPERNTIALDGLETAWQNDNNNPYSWQGTEGECPDNPNASCNDGHSYANNYYNWTAAIASNDSSAYTTGNTVAANSICPAGWRLPNAASMTGGYEFSKLLYEYGVTKDNINGIGYASGGFNRIISNPLWFVRSGSVSSGIFYAEDYGYYWSSAVYSGTYAYLLSFGSDVINPANGHYRYNGFSVRCVAK